MEGRTLFILMICATGALAQIDSRVWNIAIGDDWGAHEYRDKRGFVTGFGPDFLDAVCLEGQLDCRLVWTPYQYCWNSTGGERPSAGRAIHDRWVDGCAGWGVTVERIHTVGFTKSWMKRIPHYFYVNKGGRIDVDNLDGKTIGFVKGWAANEQCVARALKPLELDQMVHLDSTDQLLDALKAGTVDAVFSTETGWTETQRRQLDNMPKDLYCTLAGTSVMTRKDSDLPSVFNTAFNKLKNTRRFSVFCEEANAKHTPAGNKIVCVD